MARWLGDWNPAGRVREIVERLFRPPPLRARPSARPDLHFDDIPKSIPEPQLKPPKDGVEPLPLGGWLVFLGISQVIGILVLLIYFFYYYARAVQGGWFEKLPLAMRLEIAINGAWFGLAILTSILLWNESKK